MAGTIDAIKQAILDGAPGEEIGSSRSRERRALRHSQGRREMFQGIDFADKDPRKRFTSRRAHSPARPERMPDRGHGLGHQLQHGVDLDLRADLDVPLPREARQGGELGRGDTTRLPRGRIRRVAVVLRPVRASRAGSRATRSPSTATTSTWKRPAVTTTR